MRLRALVDELDAIVLSGRLDGTVRRATRDSRNVDDQTAFFAIRGASFDGHDVVGDVDAAVIVVERDVPVDRDVLVVRVANTRAAFAVASAALEGRPAESMTTIGVTGTNGKSTVVELIRTALDAAGRPCGRVGTLGAILGDQRYGSALTTPEPPQLHGALRQMVADGAVAVAMEASSIGLEQRRLDGLAFDVAVFTNLSRDHLDFHGSMEAYAESKARLFREALRPPGGAPRALVCVDDPAWASMSPPADRWTYGFHPDATVRIRTFEPDATGARLVVGEPAGEIEMRTALVGRFNAQNAAAAYAVLRILGLEPAAAAEAMTHARGPRGRMEVVPDTQGRAVLVDYAHTPDAVGVAIRALREVTSGRVGVVLGCGGDRDRGKRPVMGEVATQADFAVFTSDNPRSEEPGAILDEMLAGVPHPRRGRVAIEPDRRAAIGIAIAGMQPGDALLVAGKGHETYQERAGQKLPFDDVAVARAWLETE